MKDFKLDFLFSEKAVSVSSNRWGPVSHLGRSEKPKEVCSGEALSKVLGLKLCGQVC